MRVVRGVDASLDEEAIRLVRAMPKWRSGVLWNKPVRASFTLPIAFRLK